MPKVRRPHGKNDFGDGFPIQRRRLVRDRLCPQRKRRGNGRERFGGSRTDCEERRQSQAEEDGRQKNGQEIITAGDPGMRATMTDALTRASSRWSRALFILLIMALLLGTLWAQAGRQTHPGSESSTMVNVVAVRTSGATPITAKDISFFDNGVEQTVKSFAPDLSAAKIVLLVDNSLTIRAEVEKLEEAAREFAYEIFD